MSYKDTYNYWLTNDYFDEKTKEELNSIKDNEDEIKERFYKDLEFGTGGLRGVLGAGTNRLNIYVIRKASQGFANYILNQEYDGKNPRDMGVCIACDPRNMSKEFADETALVFNANGIKAYIYDEIRPTPQLSFSIRELGCAGGVMVTASHNPPEYNGYKVYGFDGGQIPFPKDEEIIGYVNKITDFSSIKTMSKEEAIEKGLYNVLGEDMDNKFIEVALKERINEEIINKMADDFKIVYTPLHGTGNMPVRNLLEKAGFKNVSVVKEQELPDGNFSTVEYPNPEDPKAFELAIKLAKEIDADIIIGTDPDADRVGIVVKDSNGEYIALNGNMVGTLLVDYILTQKQAKGELKKNGVVISSIVSTDMTREIAKAFDIEYMEVLTGFKYIGELIRNFEKDNSYEYILGFEESYGYLAGTYSRDKDAVGTTMLICEMATYYKSKNMSLIEGLQEVYGKYGYYKETIESITLKGLDGLEKIKAIMEFFTTNYKEDMGGLKISKFRNYNTSVETNLLTGEEEKLTLPVSNVLYFTLEDNSWFCVRPSGTEPKLKVYFGAKSDSQEEVDKKLEAMKQIIVGKISFI